MTGYPFTLSPTAEYGAEMETWFLGQLLARGYQAQLISSWTASFDIIIHSDVGLLIESKAGHRTMRRPKPGYAYPRWQFWLNKRPAVDHVIVLIAEDTAGNFYPYIVPSWCFFGRAQVQLTSHPAKFNGWLKPYLNNYAVIEQVLARRRAASVLPLPLFQESII